jgi:hypothetical protein
VLYGLFMESMAVPYSMALKTGFADAPWTYNGPATANLVKYSFFGMHTGKRCTTEHL